MNPRRPTIHRVSLFLLATACGIGCDKISAKPSRSQARSARAPGDARSTTTKIDKARSAIAVDDKTTDKGLLFELLLESPPGRPSGMRVYGDGRYRHMQGGRGWKGVWRFTAAEMSKLRRGIKLANIPALKAHYAATGAVSDGTTEKWRVRVDGTLFRITIAPGANVPALKTLYRTFSTLRKLSPESSRWRVWQPDGPHREVLVAGSVSGVKILRPLLGALFTPSAAATGKTIAVSADALVVMAHWTTQTGTDELRLYGDGRLVGEVNKVKKEEKRLNAKEMQNVLRSIMSIDWSKVPARIDVTR